MLQIQHRVRGHMNIVLLSSSLKEVGADIGLIKLVSQNAQSGRGKLLLAKRLSSKVLYKYCEDKFFGYARYLRILGIYVHVLEELRTYHSK